jgi:hypothetical protein
MADKDQADKNRLDRIVAEARKARDEREQGYREQALKLFPWVCGRCGREFNRTNLRELTVHHKDHDHDNNPPDGSNWELLCLYCHDNEHQRYIEQQLSDDTSTAGALPAEASHQPFANLKDLLKKT